MKNTLAQINETFIRYWQELIDQVPNIVIAILIIAIGYLLANLISSLFRKAITRKSKDQLMINFLAKLVRLGLLLLIFMFALKVAGLEGIATGLLTAAGASAIVVGFAFRDIGENFISGVILSFKRPFDINDTIKVDDIFGKVKGLEFRYTKLKTFDGRDVYIPNSDMIKKAVYNYTEDGYYRLDFIVGIDYEDSIDLARAVIGDAIAKTPGVINTEDNASFVAVDSLGVSTVNLKVFFWTKTMDYKKVAWEVKSELVRNVKTGIIKNGLNMPADIKEIKLYGSQQSIPVTLHKE